MPKYTFNPDAFFKEKMLRVLTEKKFILDIGGGLRVDPKRGNRYSAKTEWMRPYLEKLEYKILDPVPDYSPDYIGDIHHLEFADNSIDAILCLSVLEHVENPIQACQEMYRVLKPGGFCLTYIPLLYYYHAEGTYYKDYWRFTKDTIDILFKPYSEYGKYALRGALATWIHISPLGKNKILARAARFLDLVMKKTKSNQVSGYYIFAIK